MGKQTKNISHRLKTRHKKAHINRKVAYSHVDRSIADINKVITNSLQHPNTDNTPKIEVESITFDQLRQLIDKPSDKNKLVRIKI